VPFAERIAQKEQVSYDDALDLAMRLAPGLITANSSLVGIFDSALISRAAWTRRTSAIG
jgi:hypothetical protein